MVYGLKYRVPALRVVVLLGLVLSAPASIPLHNGSLDLIAGSILESSSRASLPESDVFPPEIEVNTVRSDPTISGLGTRNFAATYNGNSAVAGITEGPVMHRAKSGNQGRV